VILYSRPDCHLCDEVKQYLKELQLQFPHQINEVNIENNLQLSKQYLLEIPVIQVGPYTLRAPFSKTDLSIALGACLDASGNNGRAASLPKRKLDFSDLFSIWVARHWLFAINLLFILYLGLPFSAPLLMKVGARMPANIIYAAYSPLCHQLGFRSFFLFGEQAYYPRAAAGISGELTFGQATGLNENDLISARKFTGNEIIGYKVALCERDVAIYGAIIIFGFLFALFQRKIPPLNWAIWLLFAIGPIGLDGFSQLLSQLPIDQISAILPYRESTPTLRVLTGFLFGFGTAWFGLPYVEESMRETLDLINKKLSNVVSKPK